MYNKPNPTVSKSMVDLYNIYCDDTRSYLHFNACERRCYLAPSKPEPCSKAECHRRIATFLDVHKNFDGDFSFIPVTPVESLSKELTSRLISLCDQHGVNLRLSRAQLEARIQRELKDAHLV